MKPMMQSVPRQPKMNLAVTEASRIGVIILAIIDLFSRPRDAPAGDATAGQ